MNQNLPKLQFATRLGKVKANLQRCQAAFKIYSKERSGVSSRLSVLEKSLSLEEKTKAALEYIASLSSSNVGLVLNQALSVIYNKPYQFKREGRSINVKDESGDFDISERGGGLTDLLSNILRVIVTAQNKAGSLRTIILDEPLKDVDKEAAERTAHFLFKLGEKLDMNFIVVTHRPALLAAADAIYRFKIVNGATVVEPIKLSQVPELMADEVTEED